MYTETAVTPDACILGDGFGSVVKPVMEISALPFVNITEVEEDSIVGAVVSMLIVYVFTAETLPALSVAAM